MTLFLFVISACGSSDSESSDGDVTLRYSIWNQGQVEPMEKIIDEFEEENPGVTVKLETTPFKEYFTKMDAAAQGDELPDVFWMNGLNVEKYAVNDMIKPLNDDISDSDIDLENYPEGISELYDLEGKQYGIPKDFDSVVLVYNKEMFDEAGVDYPDESWDWDKFVEASKELTDTDENIYGFASYQDDQTYYFNTVLSNGGYIISDDKKKSGFGEPETIEGIQKLVDMIDEHKVSPSHNQMVDNPPKDMFMAGKVAMIFDGTWNLVEYAENDYTTDKIDIAVLPSLKERKAVTNGLGYVMSNNTDHPEEAWKFMEFLGSERANEIQSEAGEAIPAFEGAEDEWRNSLSSTYDNLDAVFDMVDQSEPFPTSKDTEAWISKAQDELSKAWQGDISVEEASKNIEKEMNEILSNE